MDKIENILKNVFDLNKDIVFFPIRHHSPACSYHVERAIELYKPDCILIEGPSDTDSLIPHIANEDTVLPISIYYSYKDKEEGRHACYYPLLDYSPEYVSLKNAVQNGVEAHFIDLPYGNLVSEEQRLYKEKYGDEETEDSKEESKAGREKRTSYYDDYFLQRSKYINALCEKENCRNYGELWEKLFEIEAEYIDTETFVKNMTTLCYFSRTDYPSELLEEECNGIREQFMAEKIIEYKKKFSRILVVTGGFHTAGLMELLAEGNIDRQKEIKGEAYLIPYSFEECDQLKGYESGMPYPAFYQTVYEKMNKGERDALEKTTLLYITKIAKELRSHKESISLSEEAAAYQMGLGLASLREKKACGLYELMDGVRSAFVKGELNISTSFVLECEKKLLRGKKIGKISNTAPIPPIVLDFQENAKKFKMDISTSLGKSTNLDIISKERHRENSVFLHRMRFLENPFAVKTYGPDYENQRDLKLIREKWNYAYSGKVNAALIEKSHMGGTVLEAAENSLADKIKNNCHNSGQASFWLISAGVMALFGYAQRLLEVVKNEISEDHSFVSLAECISCLSFLRGIRYVLRIDYADRLTELIETAFIKTVAMLPTVTAGDEKEDFKIASICKKLYQVSVSDDLREGTDKESLIEAMKDLLESGNCPPSTAGAVTGLLYNAGSIPAEKMMWHVNSYFSAAGEMLTFSGRYLRGLFLTSKDIIFYDNDFINGLNSVIQGFDYESFLQLLPDFRLSFTYFSPMEINQISEKVLTTLGISEEEEKTGVNLFTAPVLDENMLKVTSGMDSRVYEILKGKGYLRNE